MVHTVYEGLYIKNAVSSVENAFKDVFGDRAECYISILHDHAARTLQESVSQNVFVADDAMLENSIIYTYFYVGKKIIDTFSSVYDVTYCVNGKKSYFSVDRKKGAEQ